MTTPTSSDSNAGTKQTIRAPGNGRKARRKRRLEAQQRGDSGLFQAPFLHGNTVPGRLRLVDQAWKIWVSSWNHQCASPIVAVDVGIGDCPETTMEWQAAIEDWLDPCFSCHLIGTEIDQQRLQYAKDRMSSYPASSTVKVSFEWSGTDFQLPSAATTKNGSSQFIRAMNVLRDYHIRDACVALHRLYNQLDRNGILFEGSTNPTGSIAVALILEKRQHDSAKIPIQGVIFGIDFEKTLCDENNQPAQEDTTEASTIIPTTFPRNLTPPQWFQATLPRVWRHCFDASSTDDSVDNLPPWSHPLNEFLSVWHQLSQECETSTMTARELWYGSIEKLGKLYELCVENGILIWNNPVGLYVPDPSETFG